MPRPPARFCGHDIQFAAAVSVSAGMTALATVAGLALAAWIWLALLRGGYWRTDVRLPPGATPATWPSVAVVIPARDEAALLPTSLPTVLAQSYPGLLRVILVDAAQPTEPATWPGRLPEPGGSTAQPAPDHR